MYTCAACRRPIEGRSLSALGRTWHPACFTCAACRQPIAGDYLAHGSQPYHPGCYFERFGGRCAGCGGPLWEDYITALGRAWHRACFACAACRRPIPGPDFYHRDGWPFCEACYRQRFGRRCAACGEPLTGEYALALGQAWHPAHFACANCGETLNGPRFHEKDGHPYCDACYLLRFQPRCAICQQPITGGYVSNAWGECCCQRHADELPRCYSCGRLVCAALTSGGVRYGDKRWMCTRCRRTAVDQPRQAQALLASVQRTLGQRGLDLAGLSFPFYLVDQPRLNRLSGRRREPWWCGVVSARLRRRAGRITERRVLRVAILHGLPAEHFATVTAHELGHVWLFAHGFDDLPLQIEEGLCELSAYLWLHPQDTPQARFRLRLMQYDPDPVYGEGFRLALQAMQRYGLDGLLQRLRRRPSWPPL